MTSEQDMLRLWLAEWARRECLSGTGRLDSLHRAWRMYWKFCARHGRAPLPVERWAVAVRAATGGAVQEYEHEGEACLLSENRETVRDALQTAKKPKTNYRIRRKVSR